MILILLIILAAGAAGAYYYFKVYCPKGQERIDGGDCECINKLLTIVDGVCQGQIDIPNAVQYVRVERTDAISGQNFALLSADIEILDKDGVNVGLNKPVSVNVINEGQNPSHVNDGDLATKYHGEDRPVDLVGWLEIDLEGEHDIRKVIMHPWDTIGNPHKRDSGKLTLLDKDRNEIAMFTVEPSIIARDFDIPVETEEVVESFNNTMGNYSSL